jgi:serine/threonine-protein kinase
VRHILEGSVRKAGSRLRITAQLVNAADGYHLWSERYDREMDDIFAIQDEIATAIAGRLQVTLGARAAGQLIRPGTDNLEAYDEYLKGMALMHRRGSGIMGAIERFRQAIVLDPEYAPALAGLAQALMLSSFWGITAPAEIRDITLDASARALARDPGLAEAHTAAALVAIGVEFDREKAEREWNRAVELDPTDVDARANRAVFHLCYIRGDTDAAVREMEVALRSDPLNPTLHSQLSLVLAFGRRAPEAVAEARRAIAIDPDAIFGQWILINALRVAGAHDEVVATGAAILRRFGRNVWVMMGMAGAYAALGRLEEATALFDELLARSRTEYVQPAILALIAMDLGRRDEAVRRWVRAAADRDMFMVPMLLQGPLTAAVLLREQPEHHAALRGVGWDRPFPSGAVGDDGAAIAN